jgi:hypothetical protein
LPSGKEIESTGPSDSDPMSGHDLSETDPMRCCGRLTPWEELISRENLRRECHRRFRPIRARARVECYKSGIPPGS